MERNAYSVNVETAGHPRNRRTWLATLPTTQSKTNWITPTKNPNGQTRTNGTVTNQNVTLWIWGPSNDKS
eukprot:9034532-Lingulodinium_polyedra.AAC.1